MPPRGPAGSVAIVKSLRSLLPLLPLALGLHVLACHGAAVGASTVVGSTTAAPAGARPSTVPAPTLVLDAGRHTAPVRRLAASPDGRLLLTASDDKTAALWRTDTGERLHVLRTLPGPGGDGRLYGAAFHPKEPLLAVGGTGPAQAGAVIQWHAADSGELRRLAAAGRGEIKRLAWSADGRWLLGAFAAPGAVRVFAADGQPVFEAPLAGDGYGLDVHTSGRVAVTDTAGAVHLFLLGADGRLALQRRQAVGGTPVAVAFAPAGGAQPPWAVVHFDADRQGSVTVFEGAGAQAEGPVAWKAPQLGRGRAQAVAWSPDGQRLAIGGVHGPAGITGRDAIDALRGYVQEFDARTGAPLALHEVASDAVTDLRALGEGRWAYTSFDGRFGVAGSAALSLPAGPAPSATSTQPPPQASTAQPAQSTRSARSTDAAQSAQPPEPGQRPVRRPDRLWLATAGVVQWQGDAAVAPWHFNLAERVLRSGAVSGARAPQEPGLVGAATRDWDSVAQAVPVIQGARMPLDVGEISRAVARIPGSDDVVWGTGHRLARVAPGGRIVWSVRPGTETRAVHGGLAGGESGRDAGDATGRAESAHVVAAMSDGTLRWYRARDGQLLLSFFALGTRQWVLWTPGGYYDASAGAEPLLGWVLPQRPATEGLADDAGRAVPAYLTISRFRERYHRPDVIDRVLSAGDERIALAQADQARTLVLRADASAGVGEAAAVAAAAGPGADKPAPPAAAAEPVAPAVAAPLQSTAGAAVPQLRDTLPPVLVHKQSPAVLTSEATVTLAFAIRSDAPLPVTTLVVRRNGVLQEEARVALPSAAEPGAPARLTLAVPPGESVVHVAAANANGFSDALAFKVLRTGPPIEAGAPGLPPVAAMPSMPARPEAPADAPSAPDDRPRLFALLVGVSRYADAQVSPLDLPGKDAEDMARVLASQSGRAYSAVHTRVLTDERATRAAITAGLDWLARSVGPRDFGVLFIAGHALNHGNGQYYFLGHDVVVDRLAATAVAQAQIRTTLARLRGRAVLFVDTCHAGNVFGNGRTQGPPTSRDLARLANELASPENGVIVFASSTGRQLSLESRAWGNGAFTRALVAGLNGGADLMGRGRVTFQGLGYYVSAEVEKLTGGRQTPVVIAPPPGFPDFTLALLRRERVAGLDAGLHAGLHAGLVPGRRAPAAHTTTVE